MKVNYGEVMQGRQQIAQHVWHQKQLRTYTVIDVGGSATGWSSPIVDAFVDVNPCDSTKLWFKLDMCDAHAWAPVLNHVAQHGKWSYCICTHTLEDIYDPYLVLRMLPQIAHAGIITMPSVACELSHVESPHWRGFAHHRYMFGASNGHMIIAPKLPICEHVQFDRMLNHVEEIRFEWQQEIPYHVFMNNYLGPTTTHVLQAYEQFIRSQT